MKLTKKQTAKIIILLILVTILNFIFPICSAAVNVANAITSAILVKPTCLTIMGATDGVNRLMAGLFLPTTVYIDDMGEIVSSVTDAKHIIEQGNLWDGINELNPLNIVDNAINVFLLSPDKIFRGDVALLDANIFKVDASDSIFSDWANRASGTSIAASLKKAVSNIYVVLRNISAVILLCLLIYTGIRILLANANPYQQAEWKKSLIDWTKALCSLVLMHFILIGIFYISDLIVDSLVVSFGNSSITAMIRKGIFEASIWDGTEAIICTILYVYATYLTVVFLIAYFKRLVWIVVLIIVSPIVAVTQALGGKQKGIFSKWLKEYTFTVLLQPFHILIFYILVALPLNMTGVSSGNVNLFAQFEFEPTNYGIYLYALIAISLIRPAEKFLYGLFGFNESQIAKQGTSESGVKVLKQVEKVVKDVAKVVVGVGAAVATGGASTAASGAGATAGSASGAVTSGGAGLPLGEGVPELSELPDADLLGKEPSLDDQIAQKDIDLANLHSEAEGLIDSGEMTDEMMDEYVKKEDDIGNEKNRLIQEKSAGIGTAGNDNSSNSTNSLEDAANGLKDAANELKDAAKQQKEFDVSDKEFNSVIGEEKPKNKLMSKLEEAGITPRIGAGFDYLTSPEGLDNLNDLRGELGGLRDTMYLDGAPGEYNQGAFGVDSTRKEIEAKKKGNVTAYVNNKNNIEYMKQEHGLDEKGARARLEAGAPYINRGITDVATIDRLITLEQKTGKSPDRVMLAAAKEQKQQVKVEQTINDQSKISAVAQIIARQTGERVESPKVQQAARATMEQARPYVEAGKTDPQVLHRLVQLESNLKNHKIAEGSRTPAKVMQMDKIIDKAMKDGFKKIKLDVPQGSAGMQQIEKAMNKELKDRIAINAPKKESTKS